MVEETNISSMTQREQELLEEISTLKGKLNHAQSWMTRQVQEYPLANTGFFERLQRKAGFLEQISNFIQSIHTFHFFRRRYTLLEIWEKRIEAFFVGAAIILFWRGIWNLADHYLFPGDDNKMISAFASLFIGMGILIVTRSFVSQFLDETIEEAESGK